MGDQHDRPGEVGEVSAQEGAYVDPRTRVERGHRLVEQEHLGLEGERPGQRDPLGLAAGELVRAAAGEVGQAEPFEPLLRVGPRGRPSAAARTAPRSATLSRTSRCGNSR